MSNALLCPICNSAIELWVIWRAPLPTRIRCAKCNSRLRVVGSKWPLALAAFIGGALISFVSVELFWLLKSSVGLTPAIILGIIAAVAMVFLFDYPISVYVMKYRTLEPSQLRAAAGATESAPAEC